MKKYKLNTGFLTQKVKDKTTVFSGEDSALFTFNDTAAYIFTGIKLQWDREKIVGGLKKRFDVTREKAEMDIENFVKQLEENKIIVPLG